ncbi:hypothetical protein CONPUDRAFT_56150 [Coniophora puteana RWD-64-598 SS2]|uniref:Uncharacterized protein n=1 Tax=Coniophora puteana (strain RWD-64-598) TaxID=741705 RepID=A0A5M3MPM1_CONPW|nr:uncharacterized protein CONPUDRAFT_56150 [Coniophora puteana RWD-64-598 SS2]EIW81010.1 hypothetical protein CONPUDRAFT_56150 [Coniophora puteana RWD-64-598 SS2]
MEKDLAHRGPNKTTDDQFKKTFQTVGRPETTDHDIHEDFLKNPPNNHPSEFTNSDNLGKKEGAYEREPMQMGVLGYEETGRVKKSAVQGAMLEEDSVHP